MNGRSRLKRDALADAHVAIHNRRMRVALLARLALIAGLTGAQACAAADITVYRCVDAKGHVSLQDDPCPPGSQQTARDMQRPQDAPPALLARHPIPEARPEPVAESTTPRVTLPPPALYRCTSYDGIVRDSEVYDPNPRCEPLALYYPDPKHLTARQAGACRWVQDSCVRLSDAAACARYEAKRREADEAARFAFSDTMAYHKSELERLTQIVDDSCQ